MPGKHITQQQDSIYMKNRQRGFSQETSSAKAGISVRSGRRIEKSQSGGKKQRDWRTRQDPFEALWETEIIPLLAREPELTGTTLWEYLNDHYPGQYPEQLLRTLQRRVKHWRATQGPEKAVIFRQSVPAGQQGLSDFTRPRTPIRGSYHVAAKSAILRLFCIKVRNAQLDFNHGNSLRNLKYLQARQLVTQLLSLLQVGVGAAMIYRVLAKAKKA